MEKNDVITGIASSLGTNGEGVIVTDEGAVFVPGLITGEKARVKILKVKGRAAYGKVEELFTPAEERVRPVCPVFSRCGGCQLQHMRYSAQVRFKRGLVRDALKKIGNISYEVPPVEKSDKEYGYRNKLQLPIGRIKGENAVGFYAERTHRIVKTDECPLHPEWANKLIEALYRFMSTCGLDGYDEETKEGQLRHIVVRELKKRYLVTLVVTEEKINGIDYLLHLLDGIFPEYSFFLNVNKSEGNAVFGKQFILLKGAPTYTCEECGILFEAGANTFVQVNDGVRGKLYQRALEAVSDEETVIDCYSGAGLLTALFAQKCKKAYGIEIVEEAHRCAEELRLKNHLEDKMENACGDVKEILPQILQKEPQAAVALDPPRSGVDRDIIDLLLKKGGRKIVMISCNPATLARDLGILTGGLAQSGEGLVKSDGNGAYEISFLQPFDMFPQTKHVETLAVLSHKNNKI